MPHSSCNCRCVMCDIWKGNNRLRQLTKNDITGLLKTLKQLGTKQVVFSGGEALLNNNFFEFCSILRNEGLSITLLSTGITFTRHANMLSEMVDEIIVSLDGNREVHDEIRNIPNAFQKLSDGINAVKTINPALPVKARTVIHRLNYRVWPQIIESAREMGIDQISFLPADVSSHAFNREALWTETRKSEVAIPMAELKELKETIEKLVISNKEDFKHGFITESPIKIRNIYNYYAALHGLNPFPLKRCNAPWVSVVVEADGSVKPCFFHESQGNIRDKSLKEILNSQSAIQFRKNLRVSKNSICEKCVCSLNMPPTFNPAIK
ncbi:MAG TPA: radical SAM protein [Flavisolibacter sp.]|nr:radical SAM protein [Flavisolibacter sp.]